MCLGGLIKGNRHKKVTIYTFKGLKTKKAILNG